MQNEQNFLQEFEQLFGRKAAVLAKAPGRLEILGNHTDYNEGFVLSCAVGFGVTVAIAENGLDHCRVRNPEFAPGKDGMIHISKLSKQRVEKVTDVVNIGDNVKVKVIKIDEKGRVDLKLVKKL